MSSLRPLFFDLYLVIWRTERLLISVAFLHLYNWIRGIAYASLGWAMSQRVLETVRIRTDSKDYRFD